MPDDLKPAANTAPSIGHNNPPADEAEQNTPRVDPNMFTSYQAVGNREDLG
ncbi:hypothetical protein [Bradyrhizobium diazoefficiens]|uniref:hypothetical protein n=1 Tax=Bradyrhizobium diazoefficiens TaxID=1355477 RepID=UPI0015CF5165|nr:hypothetical protein [Bradyrhizobium diazoefficiens]